MNSTRSIPGGRKADLVVTDPPYNVAYKGNAGTIRNDDMKTEEFREFLRAAFSNLSISMREGAGFYVWYASKEHANFEIALRDSGLIPKQQLVWNKNAFILGRSDYHWKHEPCLYGWKPGASHSWYGDRSQSTVLEFDKPRASEIHPTMKPVELISYQIGNSSKAGDLVLDLFGGSGTTLVACEQMGRNCRTMELDEKYASAIVRRWEELTGNTAELLR